MLSGMKSTIIGHLFGLKFTPYLKWNPYNNITCKNEEKVVTLLKLTAMFYLTRLR